MNTFQSMALKSLPGIAGVALLTLLAPTQRALADCAAASVAEVREAFARAKQFEAAGKHREALGAYVHAQEYTCERNPVEREAAKRAAALALPLAQHAEKHGDFETAFRLYEDGAHYAKADAALIAYLQRTPDNPSLFEQARSHFEHRVIAAFQTNNAVRLETTGAYAANPQHLAEVASMPARGAERALQQDATAFNEAYLKDVLKLVAARPQSPLDQAGMQRAMAEQTAFANKWRADPLKTSRQALATLRRWGAVTGDADLAQSVQREYRARVETHIAMLTNHYQGAPLLLEAAIDYAAMLDTGSNAQPRIAAIKTQASKLGEAAAARQNLPLAADYFEVADDRNKSQAVRDEMSRRAMLEMQPSIDAAQRTAAQLQAQFSDPEKVRALQAQAEALRKSLQTQSKGGTANAAELEKELGL